MPLTVNGADHPTDGLDPNQKHQVRRLIQKMAGKKAIIISTHILEEVESISDTVAFLKHGEMITTADLSTLRNNHRVTGTISGIFPAIPDSLTEQIKIIEKDGTNLTFEITGDILNALTWLQSTGIDNISIEPARLRSLYEEIHPERQEMEV